MAATSPTHSCRRSARPSVCRRSFRQQWQQSGIQQRRDREPDSGDSVNDGTTSAAGIVKPYRARGRAEHHFGFGARTLEVCRRTPRLFLAALEHQESSEARKGLGKAAWWLNDGIASLRPVSGPTDCIAGRENAQPLSGLEPMTACWALLDA